MSKQTLRQWFENYWYHYKWHTLISLFLAVTIGISVTQCALQPNYDQTCILYCDRIVSDKAVAQLEQQILPYITDTNQDGECLLDTYNISYDSNTTNPQNATYANSQKLMVLISSADYLLYIVDEYGYQRLTQEDHVQLFQKRDFFPHKDNTAWNWNGSPLHQSMKSFHLPDNLYFCLRKVAGTPYAQDQTVQMQEEQTVALLQALIQDQTQNKQ